MAESRRSSVLYKKIILPDARGEEIVLQVKAISVEDAFKIFKELKDEMGVE